MAKELYEQKQEIENLLPPYENLYGDIEEDYYRSMPASSEWDVIIEAEDREIKIVNP